MSLFLGSGPSLLLCPELTEQGRSVGDSSKGSAGTLSQISLVGLANQSFGFLENELMQFSSLMAVNNLKAMGVEDIISRVRGGSSGWGGGLSENSSTITYRSWGRSLKYNPVVIDFEVSLFALEETLRP